MAGKLEARPEGVERLENLQAAIGRLGNEFVTRCGEIGIGAQFRSTHPAAQLVKLRQTEHVSAVNDQRVGPWNVQAALHNRRGQQHIIFALVERGHDVFELTRSHLSVGDDERHFRHIIPQETL